MLQVAPPPTPLASSIRVRAVAWLVLATAVSAAAVIAAAGLVAGCPKEAFSAQRQLMLLLLRRLLLLGS